MPRPQPRCAAPDALHPGENDRRTPFTLTDAGAVDSDQSVGPQCSQWYEILLDQLEHVGNDQHPQRRITSRNIADQVRDDDALAGCGRHHHLWIATAVTPVIFQRRERRLLVWTQLEHGHYGWPAPCPNAPAKLSQSSTFCVPGSRTSGCWLGCFCR